MLKRLYLMTVARQHLGQVIAFPAGMGRLYTGVVRKATLGGLTLEDHDGDRTAVPWSAIDQILWGKTFDASFAEATAKSQQRHAGADGPRPAMTDEEIAEFLAGAAVCVEGSAQ